MEFSPSSSPPSYLELTISMPGFSSSSPPPHPSTEVGNGTSFAMKDLDINQIPSGFDQDEDIEGDDEINVGGGCGGPPRKKLRLTKEQSRLLEESFRENHTLNPKQKEALAFQLKLRPRQVEVWFQNRRARTKLKQTEMECEYLKRCFGSLTEENRRLQREVEQLRALKVGPPPNMLSSSNGYESSQSTSTLTMCPRCERVTSNSDRNGPTTAAANTTKASSLSFSLGVGTAHQQQHLPAHVLHSRQQQPSAAC